MCYYKKYQHLGSQIKQLIGLSYIYPVKNPREMFMANSLNLLIYGIGFYMHPFGIFFILVYIRKMPQAGDCDLFLYLDDTCLLY